MNPGEKYKITTEPTESTENTEKTEKTGEDSLGLA
jgi:hypothetical protein